MTGTQGEKTENAVLERTPRLWYYWIDSTY